MNPDKTHPLTRSALLAFLMRRRVATPAVLDQRYGGEWQEPMRGLIDLKIVVPQQWSPDGSHFPVTKTPCR